jgi:hypothetical protein
MITGEQEKNAEPDKTGPAYSFGSGGVFLEKIDLYAGPFPLVALV